MTITEMHVLFRTLGQQQGLQLVRGILPESIDEFLNESIIQTARIAVLGNAEVPKDSRTPQYTKISPFNAFHTLYCTENKDVTLTDDGAETEISLTNNPLCVTNFSVKYKDNKVVDCRLIESERLHQTLNDYLNRASKEYPIVSLSNGESNQKFKLVLFTGDNAENVNTIVVNYIKMPKKVKYDESNTSNNIDCDLPDHLHSAIVELAVSLWFNSRGLTTGQPQQQNNNKINQ